MDPKPLSMRSLSPLVPVAVCFGRPPVAEQPGSERGGKNGGRGGKAKSKRQAETMAGSFRSELSLTNLEKMCEQGPGDGEQGAKNHKRLLKLLEWARRNRTKSDPTLFEYWESYHRKLGPQGWPCGNMYADRGIWALQRMPAAIRAALCVYYIDVDMKNAHPMIVASVFGHMVPTLVDYVNCREPWLTKLQEMHEGTTRDERKNLFRAAINRHDPRKMYINWCKDLGIDAKKKHPLARKMWQMGKELCALRDSREGKWAHYDPKKTPTANFANLMATYTHDTLMILVRVLQSQGFEVHAAIFDGVHVRVVPGRWPDIEAVTKQVQEATGWPLFGVAWKPFAPPEGMPVKPYTEAECRAAQGREQRGGAGFGGQAREGDGGWNVARCEHCPKMARPGCAECVECGGGGKKPGAKAGIGEVDTRQVVRGEGGECSNLRL